MSEEIKSRLEYLRGELRAERISYGELCELQDYGARGLIDPSDTDLQEAAGLPEFPEDVPQGHTPGPWHVINEGPDTAVTESEYPYREITSFRDSEYQQGETDANARLIAAAPELLAALETLYEHCSMVHNRWGDGCNREEADTAIRAGKAAIVKATCGKEGA